MEDERTLSPDKDERTLKPGKSESLGRLGALADSLAPKSRKCDLGEKDTIRLIGAADRLAARANALNEELQSGFAASYEEKLEKSRKPKKNALSKIKGRAADKLLDALTEVIEAREED